MVREYATDLAAQIGIRLSDVSVDESQWVGHDDVHILHLIADNHRVSVLIYKSELDELQKYSCCDPLKYKIRSALSRLRLQLWGLGNNKTEKSD